MAGAEGIGRLGAGFNLFPEYRSDQVGTLGKMPIDGADSYLRAIGDRAHWRVDAGLGEHVLRPLKQCPKVPLRIGADAAFRTLLLLPLIGHRRIHIALS